MVKEQSLTTRYKAIGLLEGGQTQRAVANNIGVSLITVKRWWSKHKAGEDLQNKPGRGRKKKLSRAARITITKSLTKRHQSTRKLAAKLTRNGHKVSHETVRKHLKESLKCLPYKPQLQPKLTQIQKEKRLKFCKERKNWGILEWRKVLFSDESPFQLFSHPNPQTDRVWAQNKEDVMPTDTVKFPLKIHVWGLMSYRALSELHIIPVGQTVTAKYYVENILEKCLLPAMKRSKENGGLLERKLLPDMSEAIFQQDGAPAHHSKLAQEWLQTNLNSFWHKGTWPGNSPDLSPIENL